MDEQVNPIMPVGPHTIDCSILFFHKQRSIK